MMEFSDIIDNRKLNLKDEILSKLDGSERIKFAVGYLYLSGFYQIADKLEKLNEAKLLIGSNINRDLMEALAESIAGEDELHQQYENGKLQRPLEKNNVRDNINRSIISNLQALPHTIQRQREIAKMVELVKEKKVRIKVYTKHPLHAKAYIFKFQKEIASGSGSEGIGVVGSSNLTMSGFYHNTELNTYVRGQKNYVELNEWFDQLWDEAVPFEEVLEKTFEESWALKTVNPYDIFILTLYYLTKVSIEKQTELIWFWDNPDFMNRLTSRFKRMKDLYPFQKVAIMQAFQWVNQYNGVFITDVVGLGKTYIGAGILKQLNRRVLVISPPGIVEMWKEFLEKFEIDGKVLSRGMLYTGAFGKESHLWPFHERDIVLIDESHHFRNDDTKMYHELQPFLANKKVILMTATPQNTSVWNIYNQIKLFSQTEENIFPNRFEEPHLRNLFKKAERAEYYLPDLLKYIFIRRTRKHIKKFYSSGEFKIEFPQRELETKRYDINETYQQLYDIIRLSLKKLTYARYDLWQFVKDEKKEVDPYIQLKKVTGTLRIFHKINLFKRLESSIYSFRKSIDNMLSIHEKFLTVIEKKSIIPAGEVIQDRLYRYELDELWEQINELSGEYKAEDFNVEELIHNLKNDISIFIEVQTHLKSIPEKRDSKYDVLLSLIEELQNKKRQEKILIFSEYADTVDYIFDRLKNTYKSIARVHGETSGNAHIIEAFAPVANDYEGLDVVNIVVASDVLSEGHNLQDCSAVINYDLHWNPVRLIQRAGRVDRIGSEAERIYIKNFLPVTEVEKEINLERILKRRIKEIHEHIGEDAQILSEDERLNEEALYAIYDRKDIETLEEDTEQDFTTEEAEIIIKNLMRDNPEYMALIRKMQLGLRSAKKASSIKGSYGFFRSGDFIRLLLGKSDGKIEEDFARVIAEIRCEPDEKEQPVVEEQVDNYFTDILNLKDHFAQVISSENKKTRIELEVRKARSRLREIMNIKAEIPNFEENANKLNYVLNAFFPHHLIPELRMLNKTEKDDERWYEALVNLYNKENLGQIVQSEVEERKFPIEFICGEIIV